MNQYERPGARSSPSSEIARVDRQRERDLRTRPEPVRPSFTVKLDAEEATSWPPGTPWIDQQVILEEGDL